MKRDTQIGVAAELSKMATPSVVIIGEGGGKGSDITSALIQAEMAKKLMSK